MKAVSIIIPARNEAENLARLLASLARLRFPSDQLEIIVVDHSSIDETASIARRWGASILTKHGGTIASVRNLGARAAAGDILAFVDADCTVSEDWLENAMQHFEEPRVGAVGSHHLPGETSTWVREVLQMQTAVRLDWTPTKWLPSGNLLVRRRAFLECDGFDESLVTCEDVDFCYRIGQSYQIICDERVRCWHHGEPKTLGEVFRKELWRGRDNFRGALRHGLRLAEIPSLLLPSYFLGVTALLLMSALVAAVLGRGWWYVLGFFVALLVPVLTVSAITSARAVRLSYMPRFALLYVVYLSARGLAPFRAWRNI
jgi:glycosyltransferase involved in cell wall biosynthesis